MPRLIEFFQNHPVLCIAFVGLSVALGVTVFQSATRGTKKLSPAELTRLINSENGVVVDVRGDADFRAGHIIDSVSVPFTQFQQRVSQLDKYKDRPLVVACRTGQQSGGASAILRKQGFDNVYILGGGMLAWQDASLPVTKGA